MCPVLAGNRNFNFLQLGGYKISLLIKICAVPLYHWWEDMLNIHP